MIGDKPTKILSYTSTSIVIETPPMNPGVYKLVIPSGPLGNAKCNIPLEYTLYVSSFTPQAGSIRGGSVVTVYGDGFSTNCSLNKVSFKGENIDSECKVIDCSDTWIRCETTSAYRVYEVDNSGIDPSI